MDKKKLDENIEAEVNSSDVSLESFKPHNELNPQLWSDFKLNPKVRYKLLEIAFDFIEFLDVESITKYNDIVLVGSIAGYNWSKYSDIDLHIVYDFRNIDSERPEFVQDFFNSKKSLWNIDKKVKIYGFDVEVYVEDVNNPANTNGRFSLERNQWLKKPEHDSPIQSEKYEIKKLAAKYMTLIDDYYDSVSKLDDDELVVLQDKVKKLWGKLKAQRRLGVKLQGEKSIYNIVWKVLRRMEYLEKLYQLQNKLYVHSNSLR
jgi:hypothetical protein